MHDPDPLISATTQYSSQLAVKIAERHPKVHDQLARAARKLANDDDDYQQVGVHCRDAFILYAAAVYSPDYTSGDPLSPEQVHRKIEDTLSHFGELTGSASQRALAKSVLAHAMRQHHEIDSTRESAERTLFYTAHVLAEVDALLEVASANSKLVDKYGIYKCSACGHTNLVEDSNVSDDGDGFSGPYDYLWCRDCEHVFDPLPGKNSPITTMSSR